MYFLYFTFFLPVLPLWWRMHVCVRARVRTILALQVKYLLRNTNAQESHRCGRMDNERDLFKI